MPAWAPEGVQSRTFGAVFGRHLDQRAVGELLLWVGLSGALGTPDVNLKRVYAG